MRHKIVARSSFLLGLSLRLGAIGALAMIAIVVGATGRFPLTLPLLVGLDALLIVDLVRHLRRVDEALAESLEALTGAAQTLPSRPIAGLVAFDKALRNLANQRQDERQEALLELNRVRALLDTVTAGLLVLDSGGATAVNWAGHRMLSSRSGAHPALNDEALAQIAALPVGGREIMQLTSGAVLVYATKFSTPGSEPVKLVSVHSIAGDLDAVEDRAWRDLTHVLAHEIMNSLTPIIAIADAAASRLRENGDLDDALEVARGLDIIVRRGDGLMSFISRYRDFANVPLPARSTIDLHELVTSLVELMMPIAGVRVRLEIPPDLTIRADRQLLEQALINILRNALEATEETLLPTILVQAGAEDGTLVLRVTDNGCGLPDGDPERLFIPFFSTKANGTGVGLSLVRRIAIAHRGQADVRRAEGGGVSVTLTLPASVLRPTQ